MKTISEYLLDKIMQHNFCHGVVLILYVFRLKHYKYLKFLKFHCFINFTFYTNKHLLLFELSQWKYLFRFPRYNNKQ